MKNIFWRLMFSILKNCMNFIIIYDFLPERMKIQNVEKLVATLHDKTEYIIYARNLKQALSHGPILKKYNRLIKSHKNACRILL